MPDRRTVTASARVSPAELAAWQAKASAAGVPLSVLLRPAMAIATVLGVPLEKVFTIKIRTREAF